MGLSAVEVQALIREWVPMAEDIDLRVESITDSGARIRIPFHEKNLRPGGSISGPIMMAAADTAMYAAIIGALGEVSMAVTSNLNINFMQRPEQKDLIADGTILKLGKRIAFCEVSLFCVGANDEEVGEDLVAHVTGSYSLPPAKN